MSRLRSELPLVLSVLKRLQDDEPDNRWGDVPPPEVGLREVKQAIREDLENLLNTRCRCVPIPAERREEFKQLERSLVTYGLPDFTTSVMGGASSRDGLRKVVEETIRRFEPRFKSFKVILENNQSRADRTLRFRIEALIHADPAPERVVYDTQLEAATGDFEVTHANR